MRPLKATDPIPASLTDLPPVIPLQVASRILGIGKNYGYKLVRSGEYPVRVIDSHGRFKVSKFDLLRYLGALTRES